MAQRIIGLDVGSWSIKAAVMESSLRRMSFVDLREHHLPVDANGMPLEGEVPAAIKAVLQSLDVDVLTVGVPGVQVLLRELSLPFADEKRVAPVIGFQLEGLLPRSLDAMVYDWHVLDKTADGGQLLCAAADRTWFDAWLAELRQGGAQPRHLTLSALAVENLVEHTDLGRFSEAPEAVIDLGHRATQVTLLKGGKVVAIRALARGGHHVTQALARGLDIAYADAEHIKHTELDLSGRTPAGVSASEHEQYLRIAGRALEPILRELQVTMRALLRERGETTPLRRVVLCGGMSRLTGLAPLIKELLGTQVNTLQLTGALWSESEGGQVAKRGLTDIGVAASALALEHMRESDPHRLNIRHGGMASASDFGAIRARAGWIAAFLALLLVIFFVRKALRVSTLSAQQDQLAEQLDAYADETLGFKPDAELAVPTRFEGVVDLVTAPPGSETDAVYPAMTAFNIFYEVTRVQKALNDAAAREAAAMAAEDAEDEEERDEFGMPVVHEGEEEADGGDKVEPEKHQVELNSFAADLKAANAAQATLTGSAFDIVTIETFASKLREHPCFKKVERQDTRKTRNANHPNWTDFQVKIEVECDLSQRAAAAGEED